MINKGKTLPEVFETVNHKTETAEEKIELLKAYDTKQMRWLIDTMYNRDLSTFYTPLYKRNHRPPEICAMGIKNAIPRLEAAFRFRDSNTKRYESLLELVLEEVSSAEAKLLEDLINGKKIDGISKNVWKKVYPEFFRQ